MDNQSPTSQKISLIQVNKVNILVNIFYIMYKIVLRRGIGWFGYKADLEVQKGLYIS